MWREMIGLANENRADEKMFASKALPEVHVPLFLLRLDGRVTVRRDALDRDPVLTSAVAEARASTCP